MSNEVEDDMKVVLEQTLLKTEEVFVYRIPPMMTAGGHNASNWDLANPAATCSLHVLRRDSSLHVKLLADKPKVNGPPGATEKYLFAQSTITLDFTTSSSSSSAAASKSPSKPHVKLSMSHWIEAVADSSRYFVLRISDEKRKKEAHIGVGFRERNDAMNFKMSLQDYENTMRKEAMCDEDKCVDENDTSNDSDRNAEEKNKEDDGGTAVDAAVSKLSLKEGEKIHINLKGTSSKTRPKKAQSTTTNSKPPILLMRKPPPPATSSVVIDTNSLKLSDSKDGTGKNSKDASSVVAVAETFEAEDDEWGDFESPSSEKD